MKDWLKEKWWAVALVVVCLIAIVQRMPSEPAALTGILITLAVIVGAIGLLRWRDKKYAKPK